MFDKKAYQRELMRKRRLQHKAGLVLNQVVTEEVSPNNLPVPVLAEPASISLKQGAVSGEARESTNLIRERSVADSRGGQNLSKWDQKKDEDRPGWYIFGRVEREINCWRCGVKYTTRLEMSRFCSPKCKTAYLDSASHLREISQ